MHPLAYKVGTKLLGVHQFVYDATDDGIVVCCSEAGAVSRAGVPLLLYWPRS